MGLNLINKIILLNLITLSNYILAEKYMNENHAPLNFEDFSKSTEHSNISIFDSNEYEVFSYTFQEFVGKYSYHILSDVLYQTASDKCLQDFKYIFESLLISEWPKEMLDSFGKPESGVLKGNARWLGEYDQCLGIYAPAKQSTGVGGFHGKYCTLHMTVKLENSNIPLSMAVCLPDSCSPSEIILDLTRYLNLTNMTDGFSAFLNSTKLTCQQPPKSLTAGAIFVIFLICIFMLLALIGSSITVFENYMKENEEKGTSSLITSFENPSESSHVEPSNINSDSTNTKSRSVLPSWLEKSKGFFSCFCLISNGERIINTDNAEGQLPCLHGIRFLSMSWVILCHAYATCFTAIRNPLGISDVIDHWSFHIILNGFYSVDSFFLLSAFLVAHLFFKQCEKTDGKIPWLYFYIHRYIRLTPVYMIVVAFYTTLNKHLGSGPIWPDASAETDPNCDVAWWMNLLYIYNFSPNVQKCMAWTWYLAIDMQFYIISPLFLVTLWRWPKIGYSLLGSFLCITYVTSFVITYEYNLVTGLSNIATKSSLEQFMPLWSEYFTKFYVKPYTRLDPYLIGIALAYYLFRRKQSNAVKLNRMTLSAGWCVTAGIALTCIFGLHHRDPSLVASSFYNALNRSGYACGLAWIIFVCISGQGGVVNNILSWKFWIPLSRLTFCAYLLHPIIELVYFFSVRRLIEFSQMTLILHYLGFLICSYAAALVTSLLFESPVIRLEKLMRDKFSS